MRCGQPANCTGLRGMNLIEQMGELEQLPLEELRRLHLVEVEAVNRIQQKLSLGSAPPGNETWAQWRGRLIGALGSHSRRAKRLKTAIHLKQQQAHAEHRRRLEDRIDLLEQRLAALEGRPESRAGGAR